MRYQFLALSLIALISLQCKQKEVKGDFSFAEKETTGKVLASNTINLTNKGVGPIDSVSIPEKINPEMASKGEALFTQKCIACHRIGSTFIGPAPNGILDRRSPEWIMNMILNPTEMIEKDSLAQDLFMEFNGQIMTNQQVTEAEARALVEYFRTLD
ncbi:MAG TPA: cytochrome c [Saprospiraceae bacterium]|nr:cytochrome c [Saprospiraceae bacterium]